MIEVTIDEVIAQKVLLFDIYDAENAKVFSAGEIMTPGKILILRNYDAIFRKKGVDNYEPDNSFEQSVPKVGSSYQKEVEPEIVEVVKEMTPEEKDLAILNKSSKLEPKFQREIKENFKNFDNILSLNDYENAREQIISIRDKLVESVLDSENDVKYCSELKLLSEHFDCHALNCAIYSICLASKLDFSYNAIHDVALGALLHDIGKINLTFDFSNLEVLTKKQMLLYQAHTIHGYKIIKHKFKLPREIALVALEHHEHLDGNGWPYGISNDMISQYSQIVSVANIFDNLSSEIHGKDPVKFSGALRELLIMGSKVFAPRALYTFVHMFYYCDNVSLKDLMS